MPLPLPFPATQIMQKYFQINFPFWLKYFRLSIYLFLYFSKASQDTSIPEIREEEREGIGKSNSNWILMNCFIYILSGIDFLLDPDKISCWWYDRTLWYWMAWHGTYVCTRYDTHYRFRHRQTNTQSVADTHSRW